MKVLFLDIDGVFSYKYLFVGKYNVGKETRVDQGT